MTTSAFKENSHYEPDSPVPSIHGATGSVDGRTPNAPAATAAAAHDDDVSSIDHVVEKAPPPEVLTKRQKVKRHCGRFWMWYLIGSIIFLAIFLPILFKVIIPAIVQNIVNNQEMPVTGGSFVALSPTQLSVSIHTSLNTPLAASIDPLTLFLYNSNTTDFSPFLNITIPAQELNGETPIVVTNQTVTITNETELVRWFDDVYEKQEVSLSTRGDTSVHLGALESSVHLDKTVNVASLNHLQGFGITDLKLVLPPDENGNNIKGTLNLPNWGVLTLGLGNLSLNLLSGNVRLGLITVYDVVLPPGNNTRAFDGQLNLNTVGQNFGAILASQAGALADGNLEIDATGNATIVNGEHISFVESVLNNKRVTSSISVVTLLGDVISGLAGGGNSTASILEIFTDIFGNSTFLDDVTSHWNVTTNTTTGATSKMRRSAPRAAMAWSMLKLGMKMSAKR